MFSGYVVLLVFFLAYFSFFSNNRVSFPFIFSFSLVLPTAGILLYFLYLIFPGRSVHFYRYAFLIVSLVLLIVLISKALKKCLYNAKINSDFIFPLLVSLPILFFVFPYLNKYDPVNYLLIGKEFFKQASVYSYPFVRVEESRNIFSFFSHPPVFSLIYSFFYIFKLNVLNPYIGAFYYILLNQLVFFFLKEKTDRLFALSAILVLAFTPGYVDIFRFNYTGSLRLLFFSFSVVYLSRYSLLSPQVILSAVFSVLSHTIGLLILPFLFFGEILKDGKFDFKKHLKAFSVIVFLGGLPYAINVAKFLSLDVRGYLMKFYGDVGKRFVDFQFAERGLDSFDGRLKNGYFNFLFNLSKFSFSFSLFLFSFLFSIFRKKRDNFLKLALLLCLIYFAAHFSPVKGGIFLMSYRYVFTVFPVLAMSVYPIYSEKHFRFVFMSLCLMGFAFSVFYSNPFYKEPFYYKKMKQAINEKLGEKDKVLIVHSPSFFLYNDNIPGVSVMDPKVAKLYEIKSVEDCLDFLKKEGFTHILMPYKPDPFVTDTSLVKLFEYPFCVKKVYGYYHYSLFKILYENKVFFRKTPQTLYSFSNLNRGDFLIYRNKKGAKGNFFAKPTDNGLEIFSENSGFVFAFAKGKLWLKNSGLISLSEYKWIRVKLKVKSRSLEGITPFVRFYGGNGRRDVRLYWVRDGDFFKAVALSPYPKIYTDWLSVNGAGFVSIGINFYKSGGSVEVVEFEVKGI